MARTPQRFLKPGETVTVTIPAIGHLTNPTVAECRKPMLYSVLSDCRYGLRQLCLPHREPSRLVMIWLYNSTLKHSTELSYADFLDWRRKAHSFQQMAAFIREDTDLTSPRDAPAP